MRSILISISAAVLVACATLGCPHTVCTIAVSCDSLTQPFDVPFEGSTDSLANARFELCRDDGCIATTMGAGGGRASCRKFVPDAPAGCSRNDDGPIVVNDSGALGGTIRVRVFGHAEDGSEVLLAERSVEMVREEYEKTDSCADPVDCVRYVPR